MNRIALSKRLEGLSSVFASENPFATDLKAMAYSLDKMSDDKFQTILSSEYPADMFVGSKEDKDISCDVNAKDDGDDTTSCDTKVASETDGLQYWSREASELIRASLVKEITGAKLTKEQTPDGSKKAEKPTTLKEEQTPCIKDSLESDIYKKSKGAVAKSATDRAESEAPRDAAQVNVQKDAPKPGDLDPEAGKPQIEAGSLEDMAKKEVAAYVSEGVELNAPMIEASLDSEEMSVLSSLFA